MASSLGFVLILLGGIILGIAYPTLSQCLGSSSNNPLCWNPLPSENRDAAGAFGFYIGAVVLALGIILLVGPSFRRSMGKLGGSRANPEQ